MDINQLFTGKNLGQVKHESVGVHVEMPSNDLLINEAVILDELGGSVKALNEFYSVLGAYGKRDGVLNESAAFDVKLQSMNERGHGETTALLTVAHEAGSPKYDLYRKAFILMEAAVKEMEEEFGDDAKKRVDKAKDDVADNARVQDAIKKVKDSDKECK
jgi:hypothetical protein